MAKKNKFPQQKPQNSPKQSPLSPQATLPSGAVAQVQATSFSGPLPHPDILAKYDAIAPGFADRVIRLAEGEAEHRRRQEAKELDANIEGMHAQIKEVRLGQIFAFLIGAITIIVGAVVATHGAEWAGGLIGTGGVVSLVSVFIWGRTQRNNQQPPE